MEYAGPGQAQRTQKDSTLFTDDLFGLASETTGQDARSYTRDNQGRLISLRTPQGSHYYLSDHIGSIGATTGPGPDAEVSDSYRYEPFGQLTDTTGDLIQPYRFAGQYLDTETGHYKIGARYYNPQLERWTQQDSLTGYTDPRRANPYIYAGQDPINQTDPTGAAFGDFVSSCAVSGGLGGAAGAVTGTAFGVVGAVPAAGVGAAAGCAQGIVAQGFREAGLGAVGDSIDLVTGTRALFRAGKKPAEAITNTLLDGIGL